MQPRSTITITAATTQLKLLPSLSFSFPTVGGVAFLTCAGFMSTPFATAAIADAAAAAAAVSLHCCSRLPHINLKIWRGERKSERGAEQERENEKEKETEEWKKAKPLPSQAPLHAGIHLVEKMRSLTRESGQRDGVAGGLIVDFRIISPRGSLRTHWSNAAANRSLPERRGLPSVCILYTFRSVRIERQRSDKNGVHLPNTAIISGSGSPILNQITTEPTGYVVAHPWQWSWT